MNFERLDILRDPIGHPSKMLLTIAFAHSFCILFGVSRYITGLNRISDLKGIFILNFLKAFIFNFECLEILRASIGHPSKKLLSIEFAHSFCILFRASRCIVGLDQTFELKVIFV